MARLQFSIRSLFWLTTDAAVALALLTNLSAATVLRISGIYLTCAGLFTAFYYRSRRQATVIMYLWTIPAIMLILYAWLALAWLVTQPFRG